MLLFRLDAEVQKFGSDITDLEVMYSEPQYPIVLGDGFFKKIGLESVLSIKIVESTIGYIHPLAFEGLKELYSVNLTNCGFDLLHPDTFATNNKLRILVLSGNDLNTMQQKAKPFNQYMLNVPALEELYLAHCNIKELLPTAFNKLKNIVYISLEDNRLKTLPDGIFDHVETIEELDLSTNSIFSLPKNIFRNTSLAILNLKYNDISTKFDFITNDLQKLDLSYNKIVHVNDIMFNTMDDLNSLNLKGNSIKKIHQAAFNGLKELRYIDLSFNDLEQISSMIFMSNTKLDVIRINDNPRLKKLPLEGFVSDRGVFDVYLFDASNCDFSELGENTFASMPNLSTLNLSWNNIETLSKGIFSYLGKLMDLDLSNNLINELNDLLFLHNRNLRRVSRYF